MTTWCRPPQRRDSTSSTQRSRRSGSSSIVANKRPLEETIASTGHHKSSRHSIADILGWTQSASVKIEQVDNDGDLEEEEEEESTDMASDYVDMADMVMSDEPLDLSLDKSKCRRVERERSELNSSPAIKRAKVVVDTMDRPASDGGTDEADLDASGPWGNVQPHLQMAANFSTVLQYYLTAARLWQTSEVIRCQESQQRTAETDSEPNEMGDDGHQSDTAAAVVAAVAAAAAAADSAVAPIQSNNTKRRKKDHNNLAVADLGAGAGSDGSRPRKTRTTFTGKQLFELERIFEQKKYLSSNERQEVARLLNVTGSQIKIWFQNRRTKWKKQDPNTAAELAQLKSASRSQQQSSASKGKSGSDQAGSTTTSAANVAEISGGEEMNSDASSPAPARSPSPV